MAADAVAEVDAPGQRGGRAVGVVGQAGEEAPDAANGDAEAERDGEEVAGAGADSCDCLGDLDGEPAAQQAADDRLASGKQQIAPVEAGDRNVFQQTEDAAAEERSDSGRRDDQPAAVVPQRIAFCLARSPVEGEAADIAEGLKDGVQLGMEERKQAAASLPSGGRGAKRIGTLSQVS